MIDEQGNEVGYKKPPKHTQFKRGDIRINRKGRPKSFDALRELAQEIAIEPAKNADGQTIVINDKIVTRIEAALRVMLTDKKLFSLFLEYAYGKPKTEQQNFNFDMSNLTDEQLKRIANGEDSIAVLAG